MTMALVKMDDSIVLAEIKIQREVDNFIQELGMINESNEYYEIYYWGSLFASPVDAVERIQKTLNRLGQTEYTFTIVDDRIFVKLT